MISSPFLVITSHACVVSCSSRSSSLSSPPHTDGPLKQPGSEVINANDDTISGRGTAVLVEVAATWRCDGRALQSSLVSGPVEKPRFSLESDGYRQ